MTRFISALAIINLVGALASISLFAATWFSQSYIVGKAKNYALESTQSRLEPVLKILENPKLIEKLPDSAEEKLRKELAAYRESPKKWLLEISEASRSRATDFDFPEIKNPLIRKALDSLTISIAKAREHFKQSFDNLILDLRIFTGTNAFAFLTAVGLCMVAKTRQMRYWLGAWSAILLVSTALSVFFYLGQNWVWSVLLNDYMSWTYAAFHIGITFYLILWVLPKLETSAPAGLD